MNLKYQTKQLFFYLLFFTFSITAGITRSQAQTTILNPNDAEQIARFADLAKVWGVISYFHPEAGKGKLDRDSLLLNGINGLLKDPTAKGFSQALKGMLDQLKDPHTKLLSTSAPEKAIAKTSFYQYQPNPRVTYLALPQQVFVKPFSFDSLFQKQKPGHSYIVDLRNTGLDYNAGLKQYTAFVQPLIAAMIKTTLLLPTERSVYYKGLTRQDFSFDLNILPPDEEGRIKDHLQVYQGYRNISEGAYILPAAKEHFPGSRLCFIVNKYVNINSLKALMALRNRNQCQLIFVGTEEPAYLSGNQYRMNLNDGVSVQIRTSELVYEDATAGTAPDLHISTAADTSIKANVISQALTLLNGPVKQNFQKQILNTVFIQKNTHTYPEASLPGAELRLLGLFNFWNAIYYFSPNKSRIPANWNQVLSNAIPEFLRANTGEAYFLALMKLTAGIKDGHSILINRKSGRAPVGIFDGNLPFVADTVSGGTYITAVLPDTTQRTALSALKTGDEVVAIDHIPVNQLSTQWKPLIVASNSTGFNREYYASWFGTGSTGSTALISVRRNSKLHDVTVKRIKRDDYYQLWGKVVRQPAPPPLFPPYTKVLPGNIGYMRMNRIATTELDSLSTLLKACKSIIIDARGYPRDWKIGRTLAGYIATKTDTVAYNEFPFVISPEITENAVLKEYEIITPHANKNLKNKSYYILVDEGNQSQGEWGAMALQGVARTTTIGTHTAGANGMAITINFPGDYFSFFSGFTPFYPDHTPNQEFGVKIDVLVNKSLDGLIKGTDEVMNKALQQVQQDAKHN